MAELMEALTEQKKSLGTLTVSGRPTTRAIRSSILSAPGATRPRSPAAASCVDRIGTSKFYDWKARFGKVNEHNAWCT